MNGAHVDRIGRGEGHDSLATEKEMIYVCYGAGKTWVAACRRSPASA
jgi:hypothetical protein